MPTTKPSDHARSSPALVGGLDDAEQQPAEADDREHRAERIELPSRGSREFGTKKWPSTIAVEADRDVHEEHRAPREVLEEQAAAERSDGDAEPRHAGPDADRLRPLPSA